jgi:hypothetical protein
VYDNRGALDRIFHQPTGGGACNKTPSEKKQKNKVMKLEYDKY